MKLVVSLMALIFAAQAHAATSQICSQIFSGSSAPSVAAPAPVLPPAVHDDAALQAPPKPAVMIAVEQTEAAELQPTKDMDTLIAEQDLAIRKFNSEYGVYKHDQFFSRVLNLLRVLSGNSLESAVRLRRIRLGDNFYRLMTAGDSVRAINYIRNIVTPIRASAEIIFWARGQIETIQARIDEGHLSSDQLATHQKWIGEMQNIVRQESFVLARYGDMQMIVFQLKRLKTMYDTQINVNMRELTVETYQSAMLESMAVSHDAAARISDKEREMARDMGQPQLKPDEIEKAINQRIQDVVAKMYSLEGLRSSYPDIFRANSPIAQKVYSDPVIKAIQEDADFVEAVYKSKESPGSFGANLPVEAVLKREIGWETLAVVKNLISTVTRLYASISRAISSGNVRSIAATKGFLSSRQAKQVGDWVKRAQSVTLVGQQALQWLLKDLVIYDAINTSSSGVEVLKELYTKYQQGFITQDQFVTALQAYARPIDGTDAVMAFGIIADYQTIFNASMQVLIEHAKVTRKNNPDNTYASVLDDTLIANMKDVQKAISTGAIKPISLGSEPNMVSLALKQVTVYGGLTAITFGSILYMISPEALNAITSVFGIHIL